MAKAIRKTGSDGKSALYVGGTKVLGTTKDGVHILTPKGPPTHFTQKEVRDAVATVRAGKAG